MVTATGVLRRAAATALHPPSSFSFSGAGFLGVYHMGVTECLLEHGLLCGPEQLPCMDDDDASTILTGVSAGALTCAAITAGVLPEAGMKMALEIAQRTRTNGGFLDSLTPGFSLIDQVEELFLRDLKVALGGSGADGDDDYDKDLLLRRMQGGRLLRIGLTDRRVFLPIGNARESKAYRYVDEYRDVEDVLAASILSSYVPGITGPVLGSKESNNLAVARATKRVCEMERLGFVKSGSTGKPVIHRERKEPASSDKDENSSSSSSRREVYWDGGLVNVWPRIDDKTIIITPIMGNFDPNPSITPASGEPLDDDMEQAIPENTGIMTALLGNMIPQSVRLNQRAEIHLCQDNLDALRRMMLSSDETVLQQKFARGYDDAKRFLSKNNLMAVYSEQAVSTEFGPEAS